MEKNVNREIEQDCVRQMWPAFALHFVQEVLSLAVPLVTSWMIGDMADALLGLEMGRIRSRLVVFILAFLMDVLVQPLFHMWENFVLTRRGFRYCSRMFGRYLHLPLKKARAIDTAALVERIDTDTTSYYFLLMEKWTRPFTFFIYLALLAVLFWKGKFHVLFILAMLVLAALPVFRAAFNARRKAALHKAGRDYEEEREGMEYGMFGARDFLNGFGLCGRYIGRLHQKFEEYSKASAAAQDKMDAADAMFSYLCAYGVPLGVIAAGALLILNGNMGLGALLSGYLIMPTLTSFYQAFEELILNARKEAVIRARLVIFYEGCDAPGQITKVEEIRLFGVEFTYPNAKEKVFEGLSLCVPLTNDEPVRLHIKGANGAGKSTLLSLLAGIYEPDAGTITDETGRELNCGCLRALVSLQEQDGGLFSISAAENLFVAEEELEKAEKLLRGLGYEKPLDEVLAESGSNLSPGEKKKLLLVRALLKPAPILALDEPLNHLDARGIEALYGWLKEEKRPVLLVSHTPFEGIEWKEFFFRAV